MRIFSVSEFIEHINNIFAEEETIIEGEVADFKVSQGKWVFFDLKDKDAKIGCFLTVFQMRGAPLEDGMKIRVFGYPKIHPKSGRFSIIVRHTELIGEGALKRAFEIVKAKLEQEGLFAEERKRCLPVFPKNIGLITSKESAAYSDFIKILNSRWGGIRLHLADVPVQGREAVFAITSAFDYFNQNYTALGIEAIILIRGGGSLEDLAAFNSEEVARAVFSSKVPVLCGIGHERDVNIADMACDFRASTPTAAAQIIVPSREEIRMAIDNNLKYIDLHLKGVLKDSLGNLASIVQRVYKIVDTKKDKANILFRNINLLIIRFHDKIMQNQEDIGRKKYQLCQHIDYLMRFYREKIDNKVEILANMDPERILARGYSIVFKDGKAVKSAENIGQGDKLAVRLYKGGFRAEVLNIDK